MRATRVAFWCDEIWSYCYAKNKNVPKAKQGEFGYGDVWTWTAMCPGHQARHLHIGPCDPRSADLFMRDLD